MSISLINVGTCYIYILGCLGIVSADASFSRSGSMSGSASLSASRSSSMSGSMGASMGGGSLKTGGGMGTSTGSADVSTVGKDMSTSANDKKVLNLQQNSMINTALNQLSAQQMPEGMAEKFSAGTGPRGESIFCDPKVMEGNWAMVKEEQRKKCIEQAQHKKQVTEELLKKTKPNECSIKISKQSMVCHTKKVIQKMVESPYWTIELYGNVIQLKKNGVVIAMAVVETLNYDVTKQEVAKHDNLKQPSVVVDFNELGGLLSQKGELPPAKNDDPCAICLAGLNKKASSMEGVQDDCVTNCESLALMDLLKPSHFREVAGVNKPSEPPKEPKPEDQGAGEGGEDEEEEAAGTA